MRRILSQAPIPKDQWDRRIQDPLVARSRLANPRCERCGNEEQADVNDTKRTSSRVPRMYLSAIGPQGPIHLPSDGEGFTLRNVPFPVADQQSRRPAYLSVIQPQACSDAGPELEESSKVLEGSSSWSSSSLGLWA